MFGAEFWVGVSFFIFIGILVYAGVPGKILNALDARGQRIASQLAEADRLRAEAEALRKSYEEKKRAAEAEALQIRQNAQEEAKRIEAEAKTRMHDYVTRRQAQADLKLSQAEAQAIADVRHAAAELATQAAAAVLAQMPGDTAIAAAIGEVKARLN